jgi:hypothetical protein
MEQSTEGEGFTKFLFMENPCNGRCRRSDGLECFGRRRDGALTQSAQEEARGSPFPFKGKSPDKDAGPALFQRSPYRFRGLLMVPVNSDDFFLGKGLYRR